jgi:hypothetical protein
VKLAGGEGRPSVVPVMMGRSLVVPQSRHGVCRFDFQDLCRADVFAADYKVRQGHAGLEGRQETRHASCPSRVQLS